ncbi:ATP-binding cassette sub-family A member 3 like protein [Argiope bruennichi]|uniref:ATP-binding cassette sub-family A member 3 like protein n=1 Tax=Argiope bruennichi TaxID=94029 RepID=A0A8T0E5X7_ARGBR|nr:ATP-binding cassette sub-family A member 3 like protein [Argiope bruennichi]
MAKTSAVRQFVILLYKGFLLRKYHYIITFVEIVFPIIFTTIPCIILSEMNYFYPGAHFVEPAWVNSTTYLPFDPFYYKPSAGLRGMKTEKALESYCVYKIQKTRGTRRMIGTVFNDFGDKLPASLNYKIRYGAGMYGPSDYISLKYQINGPHSDNDYSNSFFLAWQASIEETFILKKAEEQGKTVNYKVWMQKFPYPVHRDTRWKYSRVNVISWFLCYGYLFFFLNIVSRVTEEKSNRSKEFLKMMGMTDFTYWASTFMNYFIIGFVSMLIITIVYKAPLNFSAVYIRFTDFMVLLIILSLYMASLILFCMLFSMFFNRTMFAAIAFLMVYIISFTLLLIYLFDVEKDSYYFHLSVFSKLTICLFPLGALLSTFHIITFHEAIGEGVQWYNLTELSRNPDINILMILGAMLFSCVLYIIAIWYFDAVWPWQPGMSKPFYFFLTRSYWYSKEPNTDKEMTFVKNNNSSEFFEEEPSGMSPGVVIKNLFKKFRTGFRTKLVVNDLSLNIYQGQITALLGHNGAGKTTIINILTGLYQPTSGTASINGFDILTEATKALRNVGVCLQHDVLYDTLTVEEHLRIYAAMKGVPWTSLDSETTDVLNMLKLTDERTQLACDLSGGVKRKLSIGIAIVGGSKVLLLDEPTSGMDVEARRNVWDALLKIRHSRTIILTTHYMEEADVLGDRIAIMVEGEIQCCGSPMFLKQKFGTGYNLHVVKDINFDLNALISLIKKYIPKVTLGNELEKDISVNLSTNTISKFGDMFEELENCKTELGVISFGVTITTMDDVFWNVSNISEVKHKLLLGRVGKRERLTNFWLREDVFGDSPGIKPHPKVINQFIAVLLKRFHYSKRHWSILITQLAIPLVLMCLCLYIIKFNSQQFKSETGSLKLDIYSVYGATDGFYYFKNPQLSRLAKTLKKVYESNQINVEKVSEPTHYVLDYGKNDISTYLKSFLVGGAIDQYSYETLNLTAWFNGEPYHALPMSLLLMHTALLRNITSSGSISLTNDPFPELRIFVVEDVGEIYRILAIVFVPLAFGFVSASYILLPIYERETKAKLLQMMSGIPAAVYWIAMFYWDVMVHFVVCIVMIIPYAIFVHYAFFGIHSEAIVFQKISGGKALNFILRVKKEMLLILKMKGSTGFCAVLGICALVGVGCASLLKSIQFFLNKYHLIIIDEAVWVFRIFPTFSLASGMSSLYGAAFYNAFCESVPPYDLEFHCNSPTMYSSNPLFKCCKDICENNCHQNKDLIQWDKNSTGPDILFLFIDGIIYFGLVLFMETKAMANLNRIVKYYFQKIRKSVVKVIIREDIVEDSNVREEEERIRNLLETHPGSGREALVVSDLTKVFQNFYAVNHLTFGIHQEECFGLLGVNGAGKTMTFRMLTGECYPSEGNALIQNCSLNENLKKFQSYLGYCPQYDALIDRLTGREMLMLFGRLRGLTGSDLYEKVEKLIRMTDLTKHADKQTQFYSGGNKRKLSVAIAFIGSPPLVLLDEPTAGVDPVSRRKIWNIISQARNDTGAAILLTSHSMEESEALCNRLAIMVNGCFRCLGSIQQLKTKYGQGYIVIIKLKRENRNDYKIINAIKCHVQGNLNRAYLKDAHQGTLQYHVGDPSVTLSHLFKFMSNMKAEFELEDYLIKASSLRSVMSNKFLKLTVETEEEHRSLSHLLEAQGAEIMLKTGRPIKVVLRGLPSCIPIEEIKEELIKERFTVVSITQLFKFQTKSPMPLFYAHIANGPLSEMVYTLTEMFGTKISVERYR